MPEFKGEIFELEEVGDIPVLVIEELFTERDI